MRGTGGLTPCLAALAAQVGASWIQSVCLSLAWAWAVQDPLVILVRNNLKCTKNIVRSKRYQIVEKFVVAPVRDTVAHALEG